MTHSPRFIVTQRLEEDVWEAFRSRPRPDERIVAASIIAISRLAGIAGAGSAEPLANSAFRGLERMLVELRAEDES